MVSIGARRPINRWWLTQPVPDPESAKTDDTILAGLEEPPAEFDPFGEGVDTELKDSPKNATNAPSGQKRKRSPSPSPERETCPEKIEEIVAQMERQNKMTRMMSLPLDVRDDAKKLLEKLRKRLPKNYVPALSHTTKVQMPKGGNWCTYRPSSEGPGGSETASDNGNYRLYGGSGTLSYDDAYDPDAESSF